MGDPKRLRKKYTTPMHPWEIERIGKEKKILEEYGLKNKRELWKLETFLRRAKNHMKELIPLTTSQAIKERNQIINKLSRLGLVSDNATPDDILSLNIEHVLNRRLQTLVYNKGLARSMKQARQFIVHGHITVKNKVVTSPSYIVSVLEEQDIKAKPIIQKVLTQDGLEHQKLSDKEKQDKQPKNKQPVETTQDVNAKAEQKTKQETK